MWVPDPCLCAESVQSVEEVTTMLPELALGSGLGVVYLYAMYAVIWRDPLPWRAFRRLMDDDGRTDAPHPVATTRIPDRC